jgi:hypothetical protein
LQDLKAIGCCVHLGPIFLSIRSITFWLTRLSSARSTYNIRSSSVPEFAKPISRDSYAYRAYLPPVSLPLKLENTKEQITQTSTKDCSSQATLKNLQASSTCMDFMPNCLEGIRSLA